MQGATTDDEPMGRNPGTSEAANLTALKVRGCDLAPRFADLIEASGHVPCFKAVHMNAPSTRVKSIEKLLAPRAVPHMRLIVLGNEPRHASGECQEFRAWGHNRADGGRIWRSRRTRWTIFWLAATRRLCFRRTVFSMS